MDVYLVPNKNSLLWMKKNVKNMDIYLAGTNGRGPMLTKQNALTKENAINVNILLSFMYPDDEIIRLIPYFKNFLLDSGAFTFMQGKRHQDFGAYTDAYIDFVKKNNIKRFFEMDIDSVIGYDKVKELRKRIEREVGRQPIPVWHVNRGKEEFLRMCDEYKYVAIGGIVGSPPTMWRFFPWFIREAHKRGAKIHGLGFTALSALHKYHFDSVDSSSWTSGNKFGMLYHFQNGKMSKINKPPGKRVRPIETAIHNFGEWVKFAQWAENHL